MTTLLNSPITGVRLNTPGDILFMVELPDGSAYVDPSDNVNAWPFHVAKRIAHNVAKKRRCVTVVRKVIVEEPTSVDSPFDRIMSYVDSLKGKALTDALTQHSLVKGSDPVASKRERLIAHLTKCGCYK